VVFREELGDPNAAAGICKKADKYDAAARTGETGGLYVENARLHAAEILVP